MAPVVFRWDYIIFFGSTSYDSEKDFLLNMSISYGNMSDNYSWEKNLSRI